MAGAQLKNCTVKQAEQRIREEIDNYREAQAAQAGAELIQN